MRTDEFYRIKELEKEVHLLYELVRLSQKQKNDLMERAWIGFLCFLMLSGGGFISGLLFLFWRWILNG